ncbi:MAG: peptidyl-prolyl cis-trans isomerase [Ignavibacteriales bacterium]|nr:peptidyl-prolyl cis-trans isomerase [Ignavibacteriales bacterium]
MRKLFIAIIFLMNVICVVNVSSQSKRNNSSNNDSVVAVVGDIKITINEFVNGYEYGPAFYKRIRNSKKVFLDNLVREKLLALDGISRRLDTTQNVQEYYNAFCDDLATEELFKDEIQSKITITQEEIDTTAKQKLIDVELQWLYTVRKDGIIKVNDSLKNGVDFQKLFERELNDTVSIDDRSLKSSRYQLEMKNPELGKIIDKLEIGTVSAPVKTNDGWYIVRLKNFSYNIIPSETEQNKILSEARTAVMKMKIDRLSDKYVNELLTAQNPVIKRKPFQILRSYLAAYELTKEKYLEWELDGKLEEAKKEFDTNDYSQIILAELKDFKITLNDFVVWYRTRGQYAKFDQRSFAQFSRSLEEMIWRMIRDKLLTSTAKSKGYYDRKNVVEQSKWWLDKILYASVKNEMINLIVVENKEVNSGSTNNQSQNEFIEAELTKKLFRKINELKKKYPVKINEKLLNGIKVSGEEDVQSVDFYTVKRGGLIPRTPYPTIDNYWARWQ